MKALNIMSYKQKLLVFSWLMAIVPLLILCGVSLNLFTSSLQEEVDLHQRSILRHFQTQLDTYVGHLDQLSMSLATNATILRGVEEGVSVEAIGNSVQFINEIQNMALNTDVPVNVTVILNQYDAVYSSSAGIMRQIEYPNSEIRKLQWAGNTFYKIPPHTYQGQRDLLIVRPIPLNSSSPKGILVLHLDMVRLMEMVERTLPKASSGLIVFDSQGGLVASGGDLLKEDSADWKKSIVSDLARMEQLPSRIQKNGSTYLLSSIQSNSNGWTYVALTSAQELTAKSDQIEKVSLWLVLAICLLWGAAAVMGSTKLVSPLQSLAAKFSGYDARNRKLDVITTLDRTMQDMRHTNERLRLQLNEQTPILKEHALLNLLRGVFSTDNDVSGQWNTYLEPMRGEWFYVGIVEIDQMQELKTTYKEKDLSLIMYALRKLIEEIGETYRPVFGVSTKHGQVAFLMSVEAPDEETAEQVRQFAESIHQEVKQFFAYSVSVALAEPKKGYENIHLSYKEAQSFMIYRLAIGPSTLLLPEQIRAAMSPSLRDLIKIERAVVSGIVQGNYKAASDSARELVREASQTLHSLEAMSGLFVHLIGELETAFQDYNVELWELIDSEAISQIYGLVHSEQLLIWLDEQIIEPIRSHVEQLQVPTRKKNVQAVIAMVKELLEDDLSLQQIAEELQVPRPTLSKWFKEETGEDFREHLIRIRMDKAKEWLQYSDMPIKDISDRLRYTSISSFMRIFKQHTGTTPGAFRSRIRCENGIGE